MPRIRSHHRASEPCYGNEQALWRQFTGELSAIVVLGTGPNAHPDVFKVAIEALFRLGYFLIAGEKRVSGSGKPAIISVVCDVGMVNAEREGCTISSGSVTTNQAVRNVLEFV
jgi:hypothetical protein